MKKKIWQSILCLAFTVLFLLSALPITATAATVDAKLIDSSDVEEKVISKPQPLGQQEARLHWMRSSLPDGSSFAPPDKARVE